MYLFIPLRSSLPASTAAFVRMCSGWLRHLVAKVVLAGALAPALAQSTELVAPYVPTVMEDVELMLELGAVGPGDYLIDLGAGDGRIVITAALRGALGHGIELDRELVALARARARETEVEDQVAFVEGDVFAADLSAASVVTLYLMPEVNLRLRPKLLGELAPGTRVLSNSFDMGDWQPDQHVLGRTSGGIFLWVVPAPVAGRWHASLPGATFDLDIEQSYQEIAIASGGGARIDVFESVLSGDRISFLVADSARRYAFSGRVIGGEMRGIVQIHEAGASRLAPWRAQRLNKGGSS